ncbi:IS3 family transposase [Streptomyces sp. NPDC005065]|uniref:IS3 family transposase n=1 Tax=Streptomyces sp. NPDC005065 TaxID=3154461 RepID=UPI0033AB93BD
MRARKEWPPGPPGRSYAHHKRRESPAVRTIRDAELKTLIQDAYEANYRVHGARKIWRHLNRQGQPVARCTVERLMREIGITGAIRGKKVITTIPDPTAPRAPDLVDRDFVASAPNRCWVADFTHIATFSGVVYVAFVVDTFSRRIVGWAASTSKQTQLVLDALDTGLWQRDREGRPPGIGTGHLAVRMRGREGAGLGYLHVPFDVALARRVTKPIAADLGERGAGPRFLLRDRDSKYTDPSMPSSPPRTRRCCSARPGHHA